MHALETTGHPGHHYANVKGTHMRSYYYYYYHYYYYYY